MPAFDSWLQESVDLSDHLFPTPYVYILGAGKHLEGK